MDEQRSQVLVTLHSPSSIDGTTRFERILLLSTVAALPMEATLPTLGGTSGLFLVFVLLSGYVALFRRSFLARTWRHPVFAAGFALVGIGLVMEFAHGSSRYGEVLRIAAMVLGGVVIACLCRDRRALLAACYGYVLAGLLLAGLLLLTVYPVLSSIPAGSFDESGSVRALIFDEESLLKLNLNAGAFLIVQGAVVAFAMALPARRRWRRIALLGASGICLVAGFLPMSRGAVLVAAVSLGVVTWGYGMLRPRSVAAMVVLVAAAYVWIPDAAYGRLALPTTVQRGEARLTEGRILVYGAAIRHFPEYFLTGVGISHFYGRWGQHSGWALRRGGFVIGTHNCFAQVTVFWGVAALLALLTLAWRAYRHLPALSDPDPLKLCVVGILVTVAINSLTIHTIYDKEFSLALGLLVGSSNWIWLPRPERLGTVSLEML